MVHDGTFSKTANARFLFFRAGAGVRVVVVLDFRGVTGDDRVGMAESRGFGTRAVLLAPAGNAESR